MNKHSNGFTLVEMSFVIALMVGMALFAVQETINDYELKIAENHAMDMMTIANAAVSFVYDDADYNWPDQEDAATACKDLVAELNNKYFFLDAPNAASFSTECNPGLFSGGFSPVLKITKSYETDEIAKIVSGLLPAAQADPNGTANDGDMTMFVLKPRGGGGSRSGVAIADQPIGSDTGAIIAKPSCASGLELFARPDAICSPDGSGIQSYKIKHADTVTEWRIYLDVQTTGSAFYQNVSKCNGDEINFEYRISCGGAG